MDALATECAGRVWLIGGTSESAVLARALSDSNIPFIVSVTTDSARQLYSAATEVWVGRLSPQSIDAFIQRWQVRCILDASHPFADEISRLAIALSRQSVQYGGQQAIAYLRYERAEISPILPSADADSPKTDNITFVQSLDQLLACDLLYRQRVLFTVGYRQLSRLASLLDVLRRRSRLFVRILPSTAALSAVQAAGFSSSEIVAIRPPVSMALEKALWQQWQISTVVAKASGTAGGEAVKRAIATELNVRLILLKRPTLIYPKQTNLISEATEFCSETLRVY